MFFFGGGWGGVGWIQDPATVWDRTISRIPPCAGSGRVLGIWRGGLGVCRIWPCPWGGCQGCRGCPTASRGPLDPGFGCVPGSGCIQDLALGCVLGVPSCPRVWLRAGSSHLEIQWCSGIPRCAGCDHSEIQRCPRIQQCAGSGRSGIQRCPGIPLWAGSIRSGIQRYPGIPLCAGSIRSGTQQCLGNHLCTGSGCSGIQWCPGIPVCAGSSRSGIQCCPRIPSVCRIWPFRDPAASQDPAVQGSSGALGSLRAQDPAVLGVPPGARGTPRPKTSTFAPPARSCPGVLWGPRVLWVSLSVLWLSHSVLWVSPGRPSVSPGTHGCPLVSSGCPSVSAGCRGCPQRPPGDPQRPLGVPWGWQVPDVPTGQGPQGGPLGSPSPLFPTFPTFPQRPHGSGRYGCPPPSRWSLLSPTSPMSPWVTVL